MIEGPAAALSFYVLLAALALWFGASLLLIRGLLALFFARSPPLLTMPRGRLTALVLFVPIASAVALGAALAAVKRVPAASVLREP